MCAAGGSVVMKGGVKAGDRRRVRESFPDRAKRRQRLGLVQRRQLGQLLKRIADLVIDADRTGEPLAAVHDPVRDRVGARRTHRPARDPTRPGRRLPRSVELAFCQRSVIIVDQTELQRTRSGVNREDRHRQSTAGAASVVGARRCRPAPVAHLGCVFAVLARVCPAAQSRVCHLLAQPGSAFPSPGTRSITSITR